MSQKITKKIKPISPIGNTPNQKKYLKDIKEYDIVICQGPAGTGKTHLAVGMGVYYLKKNMVKKLIIARPAVEVGESIGYLPGDLEDKMSPFTKPCFDELLQYSCNSEILTWSNNSSLEVVPIAYMRGRTFKDSFIICDECQNLDFDQMFMLLTRLGTNSKIVLTGDIDQSDLHYSKRGAFSFACDLLTDDPDVIISKLDSSDNQRHEIVARISEKWKNGVDNFMKNGKI